MAQGAELRWIESGAGEPVLFRHGLLGGMYHWEASLEALAGVCRPMALALPILDPGLEEMSIAGLARHVERILDALDLHRRESLERWLPLIRVPTLLVWGKEDRITPLEVGERFHALVGHSQLWTLTNCGHAPMLEQSHAFNAIVREWLYETWDRRAQLCLAAERAR